MKCIVFVRVSTESQSLESQKEKLVQHAKTLGYGDSDIVIIEHKESGISLSESERIGIEELKSVILSDTSINLLIVWEISRIARRADIIYNIRDFLVQRKIRWICLEPYIEIIDDEGKQTQMASILLALFTSFAESEMQIKKERAKRGIEYKKNLGKHYGGKILTGYAVDKESNYILHPIDSKFILKLFNYYASGLFSLRSLGKELKEQGYFRNTKTSSIPHIISEQLKDIRYTGVVKGYPQIVPIDLFNQCQEIAKKNNLIQKTVNTHNLLCKGVIFNASTGYALNPIPAKESYVSHPDYGKSIQINSKYIDKLVLDFTVQIVNTHLVNPKKIQEDISNKFQLLTRKKNTIKLSITKIQEKIERVNERYIEGKISSTQADSLISNYQKELLYNNNLLATINKEEEDVNTQSKNIDFIDFNTIPFDEKVYWVKRVIEGVYVKKPKPFARVNYIMIKCKVDGKNYYFSLSSQNKGNIKYTKITKDEYENT